MRVKKFKNNEYVLGEGVWVRNPFSSSRPLDINSLAKPDLSLLLANESANVRTNHMNMEDSSDLYMDNVVIASDGYDWEKRQFVLSELSNKKVKTIGINGSLAKWLMVGEKATVKKTMTFYLANNPYQECMSFLPRSHKYYPNLVASTRTNPRFLSSYKTPPYLYVPTPDYDYCGVGSEEVGSTLDDYRNPICAAISFALKRGAKRILLLCCDESFQENRPGSVAMPNGLHQYPQQIKCQRIVDKQLFWARKAGVQIGDCSSGIYLENAEYIKIDDVGKFLDKDNNG